MDDNGSLISPKVSVLIPVHNAERTVRAAVGSILRQTFADFELVIVNDGSTDSTPAILESIAGDEPRVRLIHTPQRGIIHALNIGIAHCSGELVARMDADDISHPRRIELQVGMMDADPQLSVCSCFIRMFPRKDLLGGLVRYEEWLNSLVTHKEITRDIFIESPIAHPSAMVRRFELIEVGGYQERGWAEDYDLWLRYYTAGKRFGKVKCSLLAWRQAEGRLTFTDSRYSVENFLRAKAHYLAIKLKDCNRPILLWGAGKTGRRISKHLPREGVDIEAIIDIDRKKIGRSLRGKPIVSHEHIPNMPNAYVIAAVSSQGARKLIREQLRAYGLNEVDDFICAA